MPRKSKSLERTDDPDWKGLVAKWELVPISSLRLRMENNMEVNVNAGTLSAAASMLLLLLVAAGCPDDDSRRRGGGEFGVVSASRHNATRKDMTLLHGDSRLHTDSLPDRIRRLRHEIARGEEVYTREELEILQRKLTDCEEQSRVIQNP